MKRPLDLLREVPPDLRVDQGTAGKGDRDRGPELDALAVLGDERQGGKYGSWLVSGGPERVEPDVVGSPGQRRDLVQGSGSEDGIELHGAVLRGGSS